MMSWASLLSVGLHCILALLVYWLPFSPLQEADIEEEIIVTLLSAEEMQRLSSPKPAQIQRESPSQKPKDPEPEPTPETDGMIRPTQMLSGRSLAQENNKKARLALREITGIERMEQLCVLEAMEQIQAWDKALTPDLLLSYPFEETRLKGNQLLADGAAFFAGNTWFHLSYECELDASRKEVSSFAFKVGDPVPRRQWESHNLVDRVMDSVEDVERYNDKTRSEHPEAR